MKYSRVYIDAIGYELAPVVVSTEELEARLEDLYVTLRLPRGQLEALTGIVERRWWEPGYRVSDGAIEAARHALRNSNLRADQVEVLIYGGVCRELFEPATACRVASVLGLGGDTEIFDVSNACLGVLNGMIEIANRIELGQIKVGMVVSCETAREINDVMIERMLAARDMETFKYSLATLTGGSGAVAVLLTDGSFSQPRRRRLVGSAVKSAPQFHELCRWGLESLVPGALHQLRQFTSTDSVGVLKNGVDLGLKTWNSFLKSMGWVRDQVDRVICHQVGGSHRDTILKTLGIDESRDFSTFPFLGNMGTVSLPLTAALAEEREFLQPGHHVGFLGIGSGLNCLILGVEW